ncbi:MAG: hypothetical protein MUF10_01840 [Thermoanaerobaculaceae bacterium]|nr:hypothetical protein [Thermoanaerobaculaceae bacterium]
MEPADRLLAESNARHGTGNVAVTTGGPCSSSDSAWLHHRTLGRHAR